jgi:PAS domain S-box-containing protein
MKDHASPILLELQDLLSIITDAVIVIDARQIVVLFNHAAEKIFGYRASEIIGHPLDPIIPTHLIDKHRQYVESFASRPETGGQMGEHREVMGRRKDGELFPAEANISKITRDGITQFIVILRDITRRKLSEAALQRWVNALEHADWGVVIGQANAITLELMNPAFARLYGYTVEELSGKPIMDVYAPQDRHKVAGWLKQAHETGHISYEAQHIRKDGRIFPVLVDITAVKNQHGEVLYRVVNVQDITERKRAQAEMERRDAILQAVVFAGENFMQKSVHWGKSIQVLLEKLGQAAGVTHVYIYEHPATPDNKNCMTLQDEWHEDRSAAACISSSDPMVYAIPDRWQKLLAQGQLIFGSVDDFSDGEFQTLAARNIRSIMIVPILVRDQLWGCVEFDDCANERAWSVAETGALKAAAGTLGAAIQRRVIETALEISEQRYSSIISSINEGIIFQDTDGIIQTCNASAERILGRSAVDIIGRAYTDITWSAVHEDGTPFPVDDHPANQTLRTGQPCNNVVMGLDHADGRRVWIVNNSHPLFKWDASRPDAVISSFSDISERMNAFHLMEQHVQERTRQLSALLEVSRTVASTLEIDPLLNIILQQLKNVIEYTGAAIVTLEGDEFVIQEYQGPLQKEVVTRLRSSTSQDTGYARVAEQKKPVIIDDIWQEDPWLQRMQTEAGPELRAAYQQIHSWMGIPLIVHKRLIGVLRLDHYQPGYYTEAHARLLMAFANQAAVAIENANLYKQAQKVAALEERQRLARELHDSVSQSLYGIALGARTARAILGRDPKQATESMEYCLSLAESGLAEMRALIFELRPESLELEGLVIALEKTAAAKRARHAIEVDLRLAKEPDIPLNLKEVLYRIALEAMQNTTKHARATRISIHLGQVEGEWVLEIKDNGRGFDPSVAYPGHLGLRSMRERAKQAGCSLDFESRPGFGTVIRVKTNLRHPNEPGQ